jgi:Sec-independent protein secretion pathway component TatC
MVVAMSSLAATLGLVCVFFVLFPVLVHVLLGFAAGVAFAEKKDNDRYRATHRMPGASIKPVD